MKADTRMLRGKDMVLRRGLTVRLTRELGKTIRWKLESD